MPFDEKTLCKLHRCFPSSLFRLPLFFKKSHSSFRAKEAYRVNRPINPRICFQSLQPFQVKKYSQTSKETSNKNSVFVHTHFKVLHSCVCVDGFSFIRYPAVYSIQRGVGGQKTEPTLQEDTEEEGLIFLDGGSDSPSSPHVSPL